MTDQPRDVKTWAAAAVAFWLARIQARAAADFERMARELRQAEEK